MKISVYKIYKRWEKMGIQNVAFRPIGSYLQDGIYFIPDYQREYSWVEDIEIDDFGKILRIQLRKTENNIFWTNCYP